MSNNNQRIEKIALALGDLGEKVVFVGGCVAQLYATGKGSAEMRPTEDVDCVVDLSTYKDYCAFCEQLQARRFSNDITPGAPICRWTFENELIDFMPREDTAIGVSNRWYGPGIQHRILYEISQGIYIRILPAIYYVATKMEAILSRGGNDLRTSHDFEDMVYVINYHPLFLESFEESEDDSLKQYLMEQFSKLIQRGNIREEIECVLPYGEAARTQTVLSIFSAIAEQTTGIRP